MKVFLSKEATSWSAIIDAIQARSASVEAFSLIKTEAKKFELPSQKYSWIFFTSPNSVRHFPIREIGETCKIAAFGPGTMRELSPHVEVNFVGSSLIAEDVAREFQFCCEGQSVLFPIAQDSRRSVQKALHGVDVHDLITYQTSSILKKISDQDVYLFTSPSNVRSFLEVNQIPPSARYISGPVSARELAKYGLTNTIVLQDWKESTILDAIFSP